MATTTTTAVNPTFEIAKPNIQHQVNEARRIYEAGAPGYYPGDTLAAMTPEQIEAMRLKTGSAVSQARIADRAIDSSAYGQQGGMQGVDTLRQIASGRGETVSNLADQATAAVNRAWSGTGTFGSARHSNAIGSAVSNAVSPLALQAGTTLANLGYNYAGLTPTLQSGATAAADTIQGVGADKQAHNQKEIAAAVDKYNYNSNLPSTWLKNYISLTPGAESGSGQTSSTSETEASTFEKVLGVGSVLGGLFF